MYLCFMPTVHPSDCNLGSLCNYALGRHMIIGHQHPIYMMVYISHNKILNWHLDSTATMNVVSMSPLLIILFMNFSD